MIQVYQGGQIIPGEPDEVLAQQAAAAKAYAESQRRTTFLWVGALALGGWLWWKMKRKGAVQ